MSSISTIALSCGSKAIKWAALSEEHTPLFIDIIPLSGEKNELKRQQELLKGLKSRFEHYGIQPQKAILSVFDKSVFNRTITIKKPHDETMLIPIFQKFTESSIPFFATDRKISYVLLHEQGEMRTYFVSSVPLTVLDFYAKVMHELGMHIIFGMVDAIASFNFYARYYPQDAKPVALVYIGSDKTEVSVFDSTQLYFTRNVQIGSDYIREMLREQKPSADIATAMQAIIKEIKRTFEFYVNYNPQQPIHKIYIAGSGASLEGMTDVIESKMRIPVTYMWNEEVDYIKNIKNLCEQFSMTDKMRLIHLWGLIGSDYTSWQSCNVYRSEQQPASGESRTAQKTLLKQMLVTVSMLVIMWAGYLGMHTAKITRENIRLSREVSVLENTLQQPKSYLEKNKYFENAQSFQDNARRELHTYVQLLQNLYQTSGVKITQVDVNPAQKIFTCTGTAIKDEYISRCQEQMQKYFSKTEIVSSRFNGTAYEFKLQGSY